MPSSNKESVIILGKSKPLPSRLYRDKIYCMAGIGSNYKWHYLFPVTIEEGFRVQKFDRVDTTVNEGCLESPKTRKPYVKLEITERIRDREEQRKIIKKLTIPEITFHNNPKTTLGVVHPKEVKLSFSEKRLAAIFNCAKDCKGHRKEVSDADYTDYFTKENYQTEFEKQIARLQEMDLYFVIGVHGLKPNRQLVLGLHAFPIFGEEDLLRVMEEYRKSRIGQFR